MVSLLQSIVTQKSRPVVYVHPDVSVAQCIEIMVHEEIGALVITDETNVLGIVSERDIIRSLVHKGLSPASTKVSEILCSDITVLKPTDTVEKAMEVITFTKRRHVLVAEENAQPLAIVSIGDLLFSVLEDKSREINQLHNYINN